MNLDDYMTLHTRKVIIGGIALILTLIFWCLVQTILQKSKESNIYLSVDKILWSSSKNLINDQEKIFSFNPNSQNNFHNL